MSKRFIPGIVFAIVALVSYGVFSNPGTAVPEIRVATPTTIHASSASDIVYVPVVEKKTADHPELHRGHARQSIAEARKGPQTNAVTANPTEPVPQKLAVDAEASKIVVEDTTYVGSVPPGSTVLDLMEELRGEDLSFEGKEFSGLGLRIDSINGKSSGGGYYWFLYVNGKSSDTGVSQTIVSPGDVFEWRYKNGV